VDRAERKRLMKQKRILKKMRKAYLREERFSLRRQKKEFRQKSVIIRQRIRKDRLDHWRERIGSLFRTPIEKGHSKSGEKAIRNIIWVDLIKTFFNSTVLFILAFYFTYFVHQGVTIITARLFDVPAVLYSYRIFWPLYTYSSLYTRQALILIFGAGPIVSLAMAILFYRFFLWVRLLNLNFKILALWVIFHSINLFFGAYIAGMITRTGFIYTTEWIFFSQVFGVEEIIFLIASVVVLIISGFFLTRMFLAGACSQELIETKVRIFYILAQVFLPWLLGLIVMVMVNYPRNPPELIILYAVSVLVIIPILFSFNSPDNQIIRVEPEKKGSRLGWIYFAVLVVILVVIRKVIYKGMIFY
jgi:hypothetical protein